MGAFNTFAMTFHNNGSWCYFFFCENKSLSFSSPMVIPYRERMR
jgi:hypothetical protein